MIYLKNIKVKFTLKNVAIFYDIIFLKPIKSEKFA